MQSSFSGYFTIKRHCSNVSADIQTKYADPWKCAVDITFTSSSNITLRIVMKLLHRRVHSLVNGLYNL